MSGGLKLWRPSLKMTIALRNPSRTAGPTSLGGHNPLEAAAQSSPVVFGPHMTNFAWVSEKLVQWGAARRETSQDDLIDQLQGLLKDVSGRQTMAENARSFYLENKGTVEKWFEQMEATHFI